MPIFCVCWCIRWNETLFTFSMRILIFNTWIHLMYFSLLGFIQWPNLKVHHFTLHEHAALFHACQSKIPFEMQYNMLFICANNFVASSSSLFDLIVNRNTSTCTRHICKRNSMLANTDGIFIIGWEYDTTSATAIITYDIFAWNLDSHWYSLENCRWRTQQTLIIKFRL